MVVSGIEKPLRAIVRAALAAPLAVVACGGQPTTGANVPEAGDGGHGLSTGSSDATGLDGPDGAEVGDAEGLPDGSVGDDSTPTGCSTSGGPPECDAGPCPQCQTYDLPLVGDAKVCGLVSASAGAGLCSATNAPALCALLCHHEASCELRETADGDHVLCQFGKCC